MRRRRSRGGGGGPCGACKFLRRKCMRGCVFAPYFGADEEGREGFSAVHKVFGASNVGKLLQRIGPHPDHRRHALITIQYQAHARLLDPIYGCLRTIFALQRQVESLQAELECARAQLCGHQLPTESTMGLVPYSLDHEERRQNMSKLCSRTSAIHNLSNSTITTTPTSTILNCCGLALRDGGLPWRNIHQHYDPNYDMVTLCTSTAPRSDGVDHWSVDGDQQLQASVGTLVLAEDVNVSSLTHQSSKLEMIKSDGLTRLQNSPTNQTTTSYNMNILLKRNNIDPVIITSCNHHAQQLQSPSTRHDILAQQQMLTGDVDDQYFQRHPLCSDHANGHYGHDSNRLLRAQDQYYI